MLYQIGVFHMTTRAFRDGADDAGRERDEEKATSMVRENIDLKKAYVFCAQVEATGLEDAYRKTQNDFFENGWPTGDSVKFAAQHRDGQNRQRSSMVGDLFLFNGDAYICGSIGFHRLHQSVSNRLLGLPQGTAFDDSL